MKLTLAAVVLTIITLHGNSAGQVMDFTGNGRTGRTTLRDRLPAGGRIPLPQGPAIADAAAAPYLGTDGHNPSPPAGPSRNVFTGNKRGKVTNTAWPWRTVGRLELPGGGHCTAALVGEDVILTNAHCVMDEAKGEFRPGNYVFSPGFTDGQSAHSSTVNHVWWGTNRPGQYRGQDWALMRLDQPLGKSLGWLGTRIREDLPQVKFYMSGYSGDFENGLSASWEKDCSFTSGVTGIGTLLHNCSSSRGSSGSPIFFFASGNEAYVIALNAAEFRGGGEHSYIDIQYSDDKANIALPAAPFIPTLRRVLGLDAPARGGAPADAFSAPNK